MSWRHRTISIALLAVLTGLPVTGTVCAMLCESGAATSAQDATAASHHGSGTTGEQADETGKTNCQDPASSSDAQIGAAAGHECGSHEGTVRPAASVPADRADAGLRSAPAAISLTAPISIVRSDVDSQPFYNRPLGTAPPTSTPLVLRV